MKKFFCYLYGAIVLFLAPLFLGIVVESESFGVAILAIAATFAILYGLGKKVNDVLGEE